MSKMDLIRQNMAKRQEKTLDAFSDNLLRAQSASIPLKWIRLNPKNVAASEDSAEDVQRLADDIATIGLLHNLVVNQIGENDYMLISGERRYKALTKLGWTHAPCVVYDHLPEAMFGVMTVLANIDAREYSAAKRLTLYQELDTHLRELKRLGIYRGGIGRGIAQMMGVSERQIGKYKRLVTELTPEELANVTNIDTAIKEITEQKNGSDFQFSASDTSQGEDDQSSKTGSDFRFLTSDTSQGEDNQSSKTGSDFRFLDSDTSQETPVKTSIPESSDRKPEFPAPFKYKFTAQETEIDYNGINYLCTFGTHINGGWIAILNFGVSAELSNSDCDVGYNTEKIEEALRRSDDPWLPSGERLHETAAYIAEIVTERIGG